MFFINFEIPEYFFIKLESTLSHLNHTIILRFHTDNIIKKRENHQYRIKPKDKSLYYKSTINMEIYLGSYDGSVTVLLATPTQIHQISHLQLSSNSIKTVSFIGDQTYLALGGYDQQLRVLDTSYKAEKVQAKENEGQITQIIPINSQTCAVGLNDGSIQLWDTDSWVIKKKVRSHKKSISSIAISQDGKILLSTGGNKLIVWNAASFKVSYEYKLQKQIDEVALSPDLAHIFIICNNSLIEINSEDNSRKTLITLGISQKIQCTLIFKDYILIGTSNGDIQAWQIGNYQHHIQYKAHDARIKKIKILQVQGFNYLIVATSAGHVSLWDFIQFIDAIDGISMDYNLEGLKPLAQINIEKRLLSLEAKTIKPQQPHQQKLINQPSDIDKQIPIKQKKTKQIKKNKKAPNQLPSSHKKKSK